MLLVGLCTTRFRAAVHSSHEVYVDEEQMEWFEDTVKKHKGWKILVFSHAPILGEIRRGAERRQGAGAKM